MMTNKLEQLKSICRSRRYAGEFNAIKAYQPEDATTNPSLLFKVAQTQNIPTLFSGLSPGAKQQPGMSNTVYKIR